jgi:hypothetical protein
MEIELSQYPVRNYMFIVEALFSALCPTNEATVTSANVRNESRQAEI